MSGAEVMGEGLTLNDIRDIAAAHGILSLEKYADKDDLIRTIQLAQGTAACFKLDSICSEKKCRWIIECQRD